MDNPAQAGFYADMDIHPFAEIFPFPSKRDVDALYQDIARHGLVVPIITYKRKILDGRTRLDCCQRLNIKPRFTKFEGTEDEALDHAVALNLNRRHLTKQQKDRVAAKLVDMKEGRPKESSSDELVSTSQADAAAKVGTSVSSLKRAKDVIDRGTQRLNRAHEEGKLTTNTAASASKLPPEQQNRVASADNPTSELKKIQREIKEESLARATQAASKKLGVQQYGVIIADPPWRFETYSENGKDRAADNHYPTMSIEDICALDVAGAAHRDSVLFLWTTAPMLFEACEVIISWGFNYKSHWVWLKDKVGTGYWSRNRHELLLIATKGKPPAPGPGTQPDSVIQAPRGRHSEKPDIFYDIIEKLYPNTPRLEMFARQQRVDWDAWGNES